MQTVQGTIRSDNTGLPIFNSSWASQDTWVINSSTGNDNNSGIDQAHPIQTWGELRRRMKAVGGHTTDGTTINIIGDLLDDFVLDWGGLAWITINIEGVTTIQRTGALTAATTNRDVTTNTPNSITDSGIASWSADIGIESGRLLVPTSGNANGFPAWIVKNLGGNSARVSTFFDENGVEDFMSNGDTYKILSLPFVQNYYIAPTTPIFKIKFLNLGDVNSVQYTIQPNALGCQFEFCAIYNIDLSNSTVYLLNCAIKTPPRLFTGTLSMVAGTIGNYSGSPFPASYGEIETAGEFMIDNGTLFQGIRINVLYRGIGRVADNMVFDSPDSGWTIARASELLVTGTISGSGNGTYGIDVGKSGRILANNLSTCYITGTTNDVNFAGTGMTWVALAAAGQTVSATCSAQVGPLS